MSTSIVGRHWVRNELFDCNQHSPTSKPLVMKILPLAWGILMHA